MYVSRDLGAHRLRSLYLAAVAVISACAHEHVLFIDSQLSEERYRRHDVVRLYVDMSGDIYPENARAWIDPTALKKTGSLYVALRRSLAVNGQQCLLEASDSEHKPCAAACEIQPVAGERCWAREHSQFSRGRQHWLRYQDALWESKANEILRLAHEDPAVARPVVILIHGFLVANAEDDYDKARTRICTHLFQGRTLTSSPVADVCDQLDAVSRPVFVQVNWDGMQGDETAAWAYAEYNAPLVGIALRRLVNRLGSTPVRILTHSTGAVVAASLLGDATAALPCAIAAREDAHKACANGSSHAYCAYSRAVRDLDPTMRPPRHRDLRVGMLAPATPAESFSGSMRYPRLGLQPQVDGTTIVLGMNPEDYALNKEIRALRVRLGAGSHGATSLGTGGERFDRYCAMVATLGQREHPPLVRGFDFSRSNPPEPYSERSKHDFEKYLERQKMAPFLAALFGRNDNTDDNLCLGKPLIKFSPIPRFGVCKGL